MAGQQMVGDGGAKAIHIKDAIRVARVHFALHHLAEQLQFAVSDLETIEDLHGWVFNIEENHIVALFHFPAAGDSGGYDIDIAMDAQATVAPGTSSAMNINGGADVDDNNRMIARGDFDDAGGVGAKSDARAHVGIISS
jgi:hypothetical protein